MILNDALRYAGRYMVCDYLYGEPQQLYVVGCLSKPTILLYRENYLIYILLAYIDKAWRGGQIGLSADATVGSIQGALGRYWHRLDDNVYRYERFYEWQPMTMEALIVYNKKQHARPRSEKQVRDYWNTRQGISLGG